MNYFSQLDSGDGVFELDSRFDMNQTFFVCIIPLRGICQEVIKELHAWCAAPGRYEIRIGHSSRDIRAVLALQYADAKI